MSRPSRGASALLRAILFQEEADDEEVELHRTRDQEDFGFVSEGDEEDVGDGVEEDEEDAEDEEDEEEAGPSQPAKKRRRTEHNSNEPRWVQKDIKRGETPSLDEMNINRVTEAVWEASGPIFGRGEDATEVLCFKKFFTHEIVSHIAAESVRYAAAKGKRIQLDADALYKWIGVVLLRAQRRPRRTKDLWSDDPYEGHPEIGRIMSRDRFLSIFYALHVDEYTDDDVQRDSLASIRSLHDQILFACHTSYRPSKQVSIDKMTVPFKGHCKHLQLFKSKPHGSGGALRVDALYSSDTGYCYSFVFECDNTKCQTDETRGITSRLHARTLWLAEQLPHQFHYIYMDNLYINEGLLLQLLKRNHYALGTCRAPPEEVKQKRVEKRKLEEVRGTLKIALNASSTVAAFSYYDKSPVHMMTSYRAAFDKSTAPRTGRDRPQALTDYNMFMNGVDRSDQLRWQRPSYMKGVKWWKAVFFFFLDLSVVNAFIMFKNRPNADGAAQPTLYNFRRALINALAPTPPNPRLFPGPQPRTASFENRAIEKHFLVPNPEKDPATGGRSGRLRACFRCKTHKTRFICRECNRAYCLNDKRQCFNLEHGI